MWKYIIIAAALLFGIATWVFTKNHEAMIAPETGELADISNKIDSISDKHKNIYLDRTIREYAEMRGEWLSSETSRFRQEKEDLDAENASLTEANKELEAEIQAIETDINKMAELLNQVLTLVAPVVGLDPSDADADMVVARMKEVIDENVAIEKEIAQEEVMIAILGKESDRLNGLISAARKLMQDRQARISPKELECRVLSVSDQWDYIVLDSGINKGIVIGSRLTVMRGDRKICELNVATVEKSRAVCDVVYKTLVTGERVQAGDRVIVESAQK